MDFPINPVSPQQESLDVDLDGIDTGSRYDQLNGLFGAKCTNVGQGVRDDGTKEFIFEFIGTQGPAAGLTFTRRVKFPEFANMLLATAGAMGVRPVKNAEGKERLPLEECKGKACALELKRNPSKNGKIYTNITKVLPAETAVTPAIPGGPQIL